MWKEGKEGKEGKGKKKEACPFFLSFPFYFSILKKKKEKKKKRKKKKEKGKGKGKRKKKGKEVPHFRDCDCLITCQEKETGNKKHKEAREHQNLGIQLVCYCFVIFFLPNQCPDFFLSDYPPSEWCFFHFKRT